MNFFEFVGVAAISIFAFRFISSYRKGRRRKAEAIDAALRDYLQIKDALKAWARDSENMRLLGFALEANAAYRRHLRTAQFTRAADITTADQATQFVYVKHFEHLDKIDHDFPHGDYEFVEAVDKLGAVEE